MTQKALSASSSPLRVLLTAHADTVFDYPEAVSRISFDGQRFFTTNTYAGIGADDRAGCAIVWLLKDSGHSLLITNGEEYGCRSACRIREEFPDLFAELNEHSNNRHRRTLQENLRGKSQRRLLQRTLSE